MTPQDYTLFEIARDVLLMAIGISMLAKARLDSTLRWQKLFGWVLVAMVIVDVVVEFTQ